MRVFPFLLQNPTPLIFASLHNFPLCLLRPTDSVCILQLSFSLARPPRNLLHPYIQPTTSYYPILIFRNGFLVRCVIALAIRTCITLPHIFRTFLFRGRSSCVSHLQRHIHLPSFSSPDPHLRPPTALKTETFLCSSHFYKAVPSASCF